MLQPKFSPQSSRLSLAFWRRSFFLSTAYLRAWAGESDLGKASHDWMNLALLRNWIFTDHRVAGIRRMNEWGAKHSLWKPSLSSSISRMYKPNTSMVVDSVCKLWGPLGHLVPWECGKYIYVLSIEFRRWGVVEKKRNRQENWQKTARSAEVRWFPRDITIPRFPISSIVSNFVPKAYYGVANQAKQCL